MAVNPISLANLEKGRAARVKNPIRVNVSLKPSTHERLKNLPLNVSASIDRIVEWMAAAGKVGEIFLGESKDTHNRIEELEIENQALKAELDLIKSKNDSQLPDAAILLNQLKAKRKKSKTDLQDIEAILELIEQVD